MKTTLRNLSLEKLNWVAKTLKIISHPVRLEILEVLEADEPICVSDIQERIEANVEQSMLSHHLAKMRDNGILSTKKQGKNIFYSIAERRVLKIFDCMESID